MTDTKHSFLAEPGFQFSAALDPHRSAAYRQAIGDAFDQLGGKRSVALLGWQAATLIDVVAPRASRIVVVESDPAMCENVQGGLVARGFGTNVTIVHDDPATVVLDERADIVVAAQASTWLFDGPGAKIVQNARRNVLASGGVLIPRRFVHLFELACASTEVNGISLRAPRYLRPTEPIATLSESKHWATNDLQNVELRSQVQDTIIVYPLLSGTLRGLHLTTLAELSDSNVHPAAQSGFQSLFVPLREDVRVAAGEPVEIYVRYEMGAGLRETKFAARLLQKRASGVWKVPDTDVVNEFRTRIRQMVAMLDETGRGGDLDKVVSYTIDPHGDVSRLAALFWTVDEEFRKPLRDLVEGFRSLAAQGGPAPSDEAIYEVMLSTYREVRGEQG